MGARARRARSVRDAHHHQRAQTLRRAVIRTRPATQQSSNRISIEYPGQHQIILHSKRGRIMERRRVHLACSVAWTAMALHAGVARAQSVPPVAPAPAVATVAPPADTAPTAPVQNGIAAAPQDDSVQSEAGKDIVVTGSYIRGTGETSAIPVNVVTQEDLRKQGSPSTVELLKSLPVASGIIGESNQFSAGRGAGERRAGLRQPARPRARAHAGAAEWQTNADLYQFRGREHSAGFGDQQDRGVEGRCRRYLWFGCRGGWW